MPQGLALYCFIAAGGATGACLRYFVTTSVDSLFGKHMPFGTLTVNVVGSFALALLYGFIERHDLSDSPYRALIGVGLLGAFTTFSTFSVETFEKLIQHFNSIRSQSLRELYTFFPLIDDEPCIVGSVFF